jgi:hypothetical protein
MRRGSGLSKPCKFNKVQVSHKVALKAHFLFLPPSHLSSTMADKASGYRLEYASSARAKCKGLQILFSFS